MTMYRYCLPAQAAKHMPVEDSTAAAQHRCASAQPHTALSNKAREPEGAKKAGANCARELIAGRGGTFPRHNDCELAASRGTWAPSTGTTVGQAQVSRRCQSLVNWCQWTIRAEGSSTPGQRQAPSGQVQAQKPHWQPLPARASSGFKFFKLCHWQ